MGLQWAWYGSDLGGTRPCASTYELYKTAIPEIPAAKCANLAFLPDAPPRTDPSDDAGSLRTHELLTRLETTHELSGAFKRFMAARELQALVPSCTSSYFYLGEPVYVPTLQFTVLLFYRDQQDCVLWYLVLDGAHAGCILSAPLLLLAPGSIADDNGVDDENDVFRAIHDEAVLCAASFDEFIYRIWIENHIWFQQNGLRDCVDTTASIQAECDWYLEATQSLSE
ncbi:hypothetical protein SPRG_22145 [Saprolegnia parasitica CBS 223.65]|uniref:Uncharacterized protein n=1 Tax=Saprolegnia parasitica (strain CBS 223.65) TaxID=695850 RepID=A0A067CHK9_SAPPC|nr:hypothetical protein SPRG_22145 [Saprolegnia parasitica CBS 223.65]KDO30189.1 hypothetical protein SPRG_22145 [Saprolegnia parasitica CBS 223.65]|eukprot:XP_012199096.1 hypothetical protein SPRG_22145 [Saprolegnia parasitica CBS 223.65]